MSFSDSTSHDRLDRRRALAILGALGVGSEAFRRSLAAQVAESGRVTTDMIRQAEWISGIDLDDDQREVLARGANRALQNYEAMRQVELGYEVPPALHFQVAPNEAAGQPPERSVEIVYAKGTQRPGSDDELAFLPVSKLAALLRAGKVSSVELTELYLDRLRRFGDRLLCVATLTDDLALKQARRADRELAAGKDRGPLHGIPWGAKDLIAYPGYPTGWGATPFRDQVLSEKATVASRLDQAGAVLVAKTTLGALAQGDRWYGGMTRNPWNLEQGSSGSSAGSASSTAAGLVGFSLGSETLGSIVSPCRRCGATGLRPTFGRVSRHGCMALSWSMDKIGPIARSVEDCGLILTAIHGADGRDPTAVDRPFAWPPQVELGSLKAGYFQQRGQDERPELETLRQLGVQLVPIELPNRYPARALTVILHTEAATVFDALTREGVTEGIGRWSDTFRQSQFVPAVEYLRANRIRTLLMRDMQQLMTQVDLYVGGNDLVITNLTGHPTVVMPHGLRERDGVRTPLSLTMTGQLFGEAKLLAVADAYQKATGFHLLHPTLEDSSAKDEPANG